jgi:hypothetical protein
MHQCFLQVTAARELHQLLPVQQQQAASMPGLGGEQLLPAGVGSKVLHQFADQEAAAVIGLIVVCEIPIPGVRPRVGRRLTTPNLLPAVHVLSRRYM